MFFQFFACAETCGSFYVTQRWLGGTLTNWSTLKTSLAKFRDFDKDDVTNKLTKKEILIMKKKKGKLGLINLFCLIK